MEEVIRRIEVEDTYPRPDKYREIDKEFVRHLADMFRECGYLSTSPLRVTKDGDIWWIVDGAHRHAAVSLLRAEDPDNPEWQTIRAIEVEDDERQVKINEFMANEHLTDPAITRSNAIQGMFKLGVRPKQVAKLAKVPESVAKQWEKGIGIAGEAAEEKTLDRLYQLAEFKDDPEAVDAILNADEGEWEREVKTLTRDRDRKASVEKAKAFVLAAGIELVDGPDHTIMRYLSSTTIGAEPEVAIPETAKYARVSADSWSACAQVTWYEESVLESDDPEEIERKTQQAEDKERVKLARISMDAKRVEFLRGYLNDKAAPRIDYLREFSEVVWETEGFGASSSRIMIGLEEGVKGFIPRVYASILTSAERRAEQVMDELADGGNAGSWAIERDGSLVLRYYASLKAVGYEPTELEASLLATLETVLIDKEDDDA